MQPDQPSGYHSGNNNYDFIVNPGAPPKKPLIPKLGGGSFTKKLLFILGGAVIVVMLMWVVGNIIGGSSVNTAEVKSLTQAQQEITRVAEEGAQNATDQELKNAAVSTQLTIASQQKEWMAFLAQYGTEVKEEELELKHNATTDKTLEDAKASSTFDLAFDQTMESYLGQYSNTLKTDFEKSTDATQRTLLKAHYEQTQLLLEQYEKIK
jgi:predicted metalloprotease